MKRLSKKESIERMNKQLENCKCSASWKKYYETKAKQNCFIQIDDYVIEISRPQIESVMYYDDEYDAPSTEKNDWMFYNIQHNFRDKQLETHLECERDLKNHGCCIGGYMENWWLLKGGDDDEAYIQKLYYYDENKPNNFIRELTREEMNEYISIYYDLEMEYEKRLNTYYKKYKNKIRTHGYWSWR